MNALRSALVLTGRMESAGMASFGAFQDGARSPASAPGPVKGTSRPDTGLIQGAGLPPYYGHHLATISMQWASYDQFAYLRSAAGRSAAGTGQTRRRSYRRRQDDAAPRGGPDARPECAASGDLLGRSAGLGRHRLCGALCSDDAEPGRLGGAGVRGRGVRALSRGQLHPRADAYQAFRGSRLPAGVEPARGHPADGALVHVRGRAQPPSRPHALRHGRGSRISAARADEALVGALVRADLDARAVRADLPLRSARAAVSGLP